jgi:peroxiredoxin
VISALAVLALASLALNVALAQQGRGGGRAAEAPAYPTLAIGAQAPDFKLPAVDGKTYSLKDFDSSKLLVVVFTCNHCPVAQLYENRIKKLATDYRDRGVALVAIQPNSPESVALSDMSYTDVGDSLSEMKVRAQYRQFNFPYLYDGETQAVSRQYGPVATPQVFLFDRERKLRYQGRIDNSQRESLVKTSEVRDAIEALLAGKPVPVVTTPAVGCSIKWAPQKGQTASTEAEMARIEQEPVRLETVEPDQLRALSKNGTGKLLLVDFWATWCDPCLAEFPDLQEVFRMYRGRPLEVVTVSANYPDEQKFVQDFLEEQHASTRNLLFSTTDTDSEIAAFGTSWPGAVPYTVLIDPSGKVLYRSEGPVDPLELRRKILANLPDDRYIGQQAYWNSR